MKGDPPLKTRWIAWALALLCGVGCFLLLRHFMGPGPEVVPHLGGKLSTPPAWTIEAFDVPPGPKLPRGWKYRFWKGHEPAEITPRERGNTCIRLTSHSSSTALFHPISFRVQQFPYLNWSWMAMHLPEGADARFPRKVDHAAQIYVLFFKNPNPLSARALGYVWATQTPKDTVITSAKWNLVRYIVLRNQQDPTGVWFQERRNILEDYRTLFHEEPPKAGAIAIQIDSDDLRTSAESYFDDIFLSKP